LRVLFDTDVVLDLLLDRQPYALLAARLLSRAETGEISGYICATAITTINYLATKVIGTKQARTQVQRLLGFLEVAPVNRGVLEAALAAGFSDFEDAVVHEAGRQVGVQALVTRNLQHFKRARIPVYSPNDMLGLLEVRGKAEK